MDNWRLISLQTHRACENMAIDEAVLTARIKGIAPNTLRFYRWNPSAVSIGKFQKVENEIHLSNCRSQCVDVVRRITGGGAVYHDFEDEITYSVVVNKQELDSSDIATVYSKLYAGLTKALRILGIVADFNEGDAKACPNLTVKGKKISGSAQTHKAGVVLQHGTLLLSVDFDEMFNLLRVPWAKTCIEVINVASTRMTSVDKELERRISFEEATRALAEGFSQALNVKLTEGEMTPYELQLAGKLQKEKYSKDDWTFCGKTALG